jgi:hypothetical protein
LAKEKSRQLVELGEDVSFTRGVITAVKPSIMRDCKITQQESLIFINVPSTKRTTPNAFDFYIV